MPNPINSTRRGDPGCTASNAASGISPSDPGQVISSPESYSQELADAVGPFYTLGLPSDFNVIKQETFSMGNYITHLRSVFNENKKIFNYEYDRFLKLKRGMLFYYFAAIDLGSHFFWALRDPKHPYHKPDVLDGYENPDL